MEFNYYVYDKPGINLKIDKMPIWFKEATFDGDSTTGELVLHSQNDFDEIWGANAKFEIKWESIAIEQFYYAKEVQASIDTYSSIGLVITSKENTWLMSHEFTFWYGQRTKIMRKRYYQERCIHGVFYCNVSQRLFNLHTSIILKYYENFKPFIIKGYETILCH